jgi:NADH:ubiquinone oxidoreductase subunit 5 (subunit L)/multisubunit Na+/H+ antiporter MnhA subunit
MLLLVLGGNLVFLYLGWEGVTYEATSLVWHTDPEMGMPQERLYYYTY